MNFLSILEYLKTLDNFNKYHPIICVGCHEIFEEYYDYYIIDGIVYIVAITSSDIGSGGYKTISMINPSHITNVYIDDAMNADLSAIESPENPASYGDFKSKVTTFLNGCISNPNNFNLPYSKARFLVGDESIRVHEDGIAVNGDLVSFDISEVSLGAIVGKPGNPMYSDYRMFTNLDKFQVITIPFEDLIYSPMTGFVTEELKTLCKTFRETHFGKWGNGVLPYNRGEYAKGDRVWLDVQVVSKSGNTANEKPEKRMWFVSLANKNSDIPLSKNAKANESWAEYDPETNELIVEEPEG